MTGRVHKTDIAVKGGQDGKQYLPISAHRRSGGFLVLSTHRLLKSERGSSPRCRSPLGSYILSLETARLAASRSFPMVCFFDFTLTFRHGGILVNGNNIYLIEAARLIGTGIRWGVRTYGVATRNPSIYRTALAIQSGRQIS